jgi:Zn-dependent peptidase ImmA (M78 family)
MVVAHINGKMLTWARTRAGLTLSAVAKGKITVEKLIAWESGDDLPTESQAQALAEKLGISYAMLFMPEVPPPDTPNIPDLRTKSGQPLRNPSLDFRDVYNDALVRQDWMRDQRQDEGRTPLQFIGQYSLDSDPKKVAQSMRRVLDLATSARVDCPDFEEFLRHLVRTAEHAGILVMRSAIVRHATRRKLNENEFRGFALTDTYAPLVFINDSDAKAAQIFTLAHELAHLWIGANGVSDRRPDQHGDSQNEIELFCDKVAAELLAPESEFRAKWLRGDTLKTARTAANFFKVSTLVALRRAKDLDLITFGAFVDSVRSEYARFREIERRKRDKPKEKEKSGGNFWASFEIRNGAPLNAAVVRALNTRRTTFTEASVLLGLNLGSTLRYLQRVTAK